MTHIGFDDPRKFVPQAATEEQTFIPFRRVRDEIREFICREALQS